MTFLLPALLAFAGALEPGKTAPDFRLAALDGSEVALAAVLADPSTRALAVLFTSAACPFSLRADADLVSLAKTWAGKGVRIVALYPGAGEDAGAIRRHAGEAGVDWPLALDPGAATAASFGAEVTPTFFLLDRAGVLRYRGPFEHLGGAVEAVLAGDAVSVPVAPAVGSTIRRAGEPAPADPIREWVAKLVDALAAPEEPVRRSARAALAALGPDALPHLRAIRGTAEGERAALVDRAIEALGTGVPTPAPGPAGRGGNLLANQKRVIEENLDLDADQKAKLDAAFADLAKREAEIRAAAGRGDREGARAGLGELRAAAKAALEQILTPEQLEKLRTLREGRGAREGRGNGRIPR